MGTGCSCIQNNDEKHVFLRAPEDLRLRRSISKRVFDKQKHKSPQVDERNQEEAYKEATTAIVTSRKKTDQDIANILKTLKGHFIFKSLDQDSQMSILDSVKHYSVGPREVIFEQGQPGVCFFCVAKGRLEVLCNGERTAVIGPGTGFGELALLDSSPRTATIRTLEPCSLWGVDRKTFNTAIKKLNQINYEENKKFFNTIHLFSALSPSQKEDLLAVCVTQKWACGQSIVKEGEDGDLFYIIKEGIVTCVENKSEKRQLVKGDYFGEQALLYNKPRTATVIALTDVKVISIGRGDLLQALGTTLELALYKNSLLIAVDRSNVLRCLSSAQVEALVEAFELKKFHPGQVVISRGTPKVQGIFIIVKGQLRGTLTDLEVYQCLGDVEVTEGSQELYPVDFIANQEVDVAFVSREKIDQVIGGGIKEVILTNEARNILQKVPLFKNLPSSKVADLAKALEVRSFGDKEVILQQGSENQSFFIIKSGTVKVFKDGLYIRDMGKYDYFGERASLTENSRSAEVSSVGYSELWVISKSHFMQIIDSQILQVLLSRIEIFDSKVELNDLMPVKLLGSGKFANVLLVQHQTRQTRFALKSVSRAKVQTYNIFDNLSLERNLLMQIDHPLIVKLVKTFKDFERVYFLLEYVKGLDLFDVLLELDTVREESARFYTACLVLTLEHLHERSIVHRDLKPENVMIDFEGYTKLVDFGTSKIVEGRTYTTLGTPHYIAPEIILKAGYSTHVDLWSLGIMVYEIIYGKVPFGADDDEPKVIYQKVLEHKLDLKTSPYPGNNYKTFISQLLNQNPAARLAGSMERLKSHPWLANFNWERLISRQLKAPYIPKVDMGSTEVTGNLIEELRKLERAESERFGEKNNDRWDTLF
jgi:cGMP-dependent protein kinase